MSEKIRVKVGSLELEWESDNSLSLEDVKSLLKEIGEIGTLPPSPSVQGAETPSHETPTKGNPEAARANEAQKLFITTIAAKLQVKGGPDLAVAAAAYLQLTEGKEKFSRQELLEAMKKAPMYYQENMRKNLSRLIDGLIPKKFNQVDANAYALTASARSSIETALA